MESLKKNGQEHIHWWLSGFLHHAGRAIYSDVSDKHVTPALGWLGFVQVYAKQNAALLRNIVGKGWSYTVKTQKKHIQDYIEIVIKSSNVHIGGTQNKNACDRNSIIVKVLPITGHEGPEGEYRYSPTLSWPRRLDGGG